MDSSTIGAAEESQTDAVKLAREACQEAANGAELGSNVGKDNSPAGRCQR
jgi:hypothetical protein